MNSTWNVWKGVFSCDPLPAAPSSRPSSGSSILISGRSLGWVGAEDGKLRGNFEGGGSSGEKTEKQK